MACIPRHQRDLEEFQGPSSTFEKGQIRLRRSSGPRRTVVRKVGLVKQRAQQTGGAIEADQVAYFAVVIFQHNALAIHKHKRLVARLVHDIGDHVLHWVIMLVLSEKGQKALGSVQRCAIQNDPSPPNILVIRKNGALETSFSKLHTEVPSMYHLICHSEELRGGLSACNVQRREI